MSKVLTCGDRFCEFIIIWEGLEERSGIGMIAVLGLNPKELSVSAGTRNARVRPTCDRSSRFGDGIGIARGALPQMIRNQSHVYKERNCLCIFITREFIQKAMIVGVRMLT